MSFIKIGDKKIFSKIFEKNPKGGPFYVKKFFVTDSAQISCVKSLGHKDFKFWISSKSETKNFFFSKGGTLWCFSRNRDFENQKNVKGPPLEKKFFFVSDFDETQNLKSLWPRDFTHEIWAESEPKIFLTPNQFGCLNFSRLDFSKNSKTNGKTDFTQLKLRFEVTKSKSLVSLTLVLWKRQKDLWSSGP